MNLLRLLDQFLQSDPNYKFSLQFTKDQFRLEIKIS
jgi:hypothetical protein